MSAVTTDATEVAEIVAFVLSQETVIIVSVPTVVTSVIKVIVGNKFVESDIY